MRFDDTNPSKEKEEYEINILRDIAALEVVPDLFSHTSDHFDLCIEKGKELIENGFAYMDDTPQKQMQKERTSKIDSQRRDLSIEESFLHLS